MSSIYDFMMKEDELNKLLAPRNKALSECVSNIDPVLTHNQWALIIDGIGQGTIKGYQDLMEGFGFDVQVAMAIWENNKLISKISNVLVNQAKSALLTRGVKRLEDIFIQGGEGDTDQAIAAIDKLAKIVTATKEEKETNNSVNIQLNLESVLRASNNRGKKGVIDV